MVHRLYLDLSNYVSPLSGFFPVFLLSRSWISCLSIRWVIGLSGMVLFPSGIQFVGTVFSSPFSLLFLSFFSFFVPPLRTFSSSSSLAESLSDLRERESDYSINC